MSSEDFDPDVDAIGRADPWQERSPELPSDLACSVCGGVVESGEQCLELRHGRNVLGEFRDGDRPACVVCRDCGGR